MIHAKKYTKLIKQIPKLSDEEYLAFQVSQLTNMFSREKAAIKNIDLEYIAFTNHFADEFDFDETCLGQTTQQIAEQTPEAAKQIHQQEMEIITTQLHKSVLFFRKADSYNICFMMRKFPLINPSTQNIVGILITAKRMNIMKFRNLLSKHIFRRNIEPPMEVEKQLNEKQLLIVTCLLLGFHKRKEIANLLNRSFMKGVNEIQIKNSLQTLYDRYKCNSTMELIELISNSDNFEYEISASLASEGVMPIQEKE